MQFNWLILALYHWGLRHRPARDAHQARSMTRLMSEACQRAQRLQRAKQQHSHQQARQQTQQHALQHEQHVAQQTKNMALTKRGTSRQLWLPL